MAQDRNQALTLARALRELRQNTWPEAVPTQAQLATAFSSEEGRVAPATVSSWESMTAPKMPPIARISGYARFFSTKRSLDGAPHLVAEEELDQDELARFRTLEGRLLDLLAPDGHQAGHTFQFETGPVIVICPKAPSHLQGPLAAEQHRNFNKLQQYGDLDALIELYGHLRAENPKLDVFHRLTGEVVSDDLSSHVVLLGGIGWNIVTRRFQRGLGQVPVTQIVVDDLDGGDVFTISGPDGKLVQTLYPELDEDDELIADVGYIARLRNPFNIHRTLTICNGIFTSGVYGAVRCLTDASVRDENERYLAERFPEGEFAILVRVPVVANEVVSPVLQNPESRFFEWPPGRGDRG